MIFKQSRWGSGGGLIMIFTKSHVISTLETVDSGHLASSDLHGFHKSISEFILYSVHMISAQ